MKNTVLRAVDDGAVKGLGRVPRVRTASGWIKQVRGWPLNGTEGLSGRGRKPAAPELQTREKPKGFPEGPGQEMPGKEGPPESGKPGHIWRPLDAPLGWRRVGPAGKCRKNNLLPKVAITNP